MRKEDLNAFKGEIKTALQTWAEGKIDALFPGKASVRTLMKRGLNNYLVREDVKINKALDYGFLFLADERGVIDTDSMTETLKGLFSEMDKKDFHFGFIHVSVGKGVAEINIDSSPLFDFVVGDFGGVRFSADDIDEFKTFLN